MLAATLPVLDLLERYVPVDDVVLHYRTWGSGPPLYLLHGGPGGSGRYWPAAVPGLGDTHTVYAIDLRGHGLSGRTPPYTIARFAEDITGFARALGHERYVLLGHSLGALVAMCAVTKDPNVRALILVGGFPYSKGLFLHPRGLGTKLRLSVRLAHWNLQHLLGLAPPMRDMLRQLLRDARPLLHARGADKDRIDRILAASIVEPLDAVLPLQRDLLDWDHRDALVDIRTPTLVVAGDQDALALPSARDLARHIPHARLVRIPCAGHSPFFDQPERFQEEVVRFLAAARAGGKVKSAASYAKVDG